MCGNYRRRLSLSMLLAIAAAVAIADAIVTRKGDGKTRSGQSTITHTMHICFKWSTHKTNKISTPNIIIDTSNERNKVKVACVIPLCVSW